MVSVAPSVETDATGAAPLAPSSSTTIDFHKFFHLDLVEDARALPLPDLLFVVTVSGFAMLLRMD
jgi:hypothetical protein